MPDQRAVRSREEVESAIRAFTDADWTKLGLVSKGYAYRRHLDPEDLLQQSLMSALEGRKCPVDVDIIVFLYQTIRSTARGELEKSAIRPKIAAGVDPNDPQAMPNQSQLSMLSPEEEWVATEDSVERRSTILALFADKPEALTIVEGIMAGFSGAELRELSGLDEKSYDSTRKLINRRINKQYSRNKPYEPK